MMSYDIRYQILVKNPNIPAGYNVCMLPGRTTTLFENLEDAQAKIDELLAAGVLIFETEADFAQVCPDIGFDEGKLIGMQWFLQLKPQDRGAEATAFFSDMQNKSKSFDLWLKTAPPIEWPAQVKAYFCGSE